MLCARFPWPANRMIHLMRLAFCPPPFHDDALFLFLNSAAGIARGSNLLPRFRSRNRISANSLMQHDILLLGLLIDFCPKAQKSEPSQSMKASLPSDAGFLKSWKLLLQPRLVVVRTDIWKALERRADYFIPRKRFDRHCGEVEPPAEADCVGRTDGLAVIRAERHPLKYWQRSN